MSACTRTDLVRDISRQHAEQNFSGGRRESDIEIFGHLLEMLRFKQRPQIVELPCDQERHPDQFGIAEHALEVVRLE